MAPCRISYYAGHESYLYIGCIDCEVVQLDLQCEVIANANVRHLGLDHLITGACRVQKLDLEKKVALCTSSVAYQGGRKPQFQINYDLVVRYLFLGPNSEYDG